MTTAAEGFSIAFGMAVALYFTIYFVWLMFLSWLVSRVIWDGQPLIRAALCVGIGVLVAWAIHFVLQPLGLNLIVVPRLFWGAALIAEFSVPLAVFLWEWRSFNRHWIDDEEIFE